MASYSNDQLIGRNNEEGLAMKIKTPSEEYLQKAKLLTEEEVERLHSRMKGKLHRRLEDKKVDTIEALAIQLETEDEHLQEWRARMSEIREKHKT
jgi:hypothetical protein